MASTSFHGSSSFHLASVMGVLAISGGLGCGARSTLGWGEGGSPGTTSSTVTGSSHSSSVASTSVASTTIASSSTGGCLEGATLPCGSNVGACKQGVVTCHNNVYGACVGAIGPKPETCNGIDDDCNGVIDDGFHIGEPCKGTGTDQCLDGVTTCQGCKKTGPDKVEICNGIDDNCNGIIDADCQVGDCKPSLLVTGSTPSSPNCVDFPVMAGSMGSIEYPCGGGPVTATLGSIQFTGSVTNNNVTLDGYETISPPTTPDGCTWKNHHHIDGYLPSGVINYSYSEMVIVQPPGKTCWSPCTETGTVKINWLMPGG